MRPRTVLFNAISLDGYTTGFTVDQGQFYGITQSWGEDATLAGCDTLLAATDPDFVAPDKPATPTGRDDPRPVLVLVDSRGRLKGWPYWQAQPFWKDWIALCTDQTPQDHIEKLRRIGVTPLRIGRNKVDLPRALDVLATDYGVSKVRLESGGKLNSALVNLGLADEIHVLVHPVLAGATRTSSFASDFNAPEALPLRMKATEQKPDGLVLLSYEVVR